MGNKFAITDLSVAEIEKQRKELSSIRKLKQEDLNCSLNYHVTVCYPLIDIDKTEYGFGQKFNTTDTLEYFKIMKKFANNKLSDLFKNKEEYHLNPTPINENIKKALQTIFPDVDPYDFREFMYHFGLYTDEKGNADRNTDVRSPRIHFLLGCDGYIYPLFFDPYHEIQPGKSKKPKYIDRAKLGQKIKKRK
ncbi:MAG: hypothetical protein IKJ67_01905 [Bacteroidales bacterium]|nr:hypothetical protein [Bacteroidales bacterium]